MGKIIALLVLLLVGNAAFLAWLFWSRRRGSGTNTGTSKDSNAHDSPNRKSAGRVTRGSDGVLRAERVTDNAGTIRIDTDASVGPGSAGADSARRSIAVGTDIGTAGGVVIYRESGPDKPVNNGADVHDDCATARATPSAPAWTRPEGPFMVPPIVQIGSDSTRLDSVEILFFAHADQHGFTVKAFSDRQLVVSEFTQTPICLEGIPPHRRYSCTVSGLLPGESFKYWVIQGGKVVFETESMARKGRGTPHRFVVVGDMGNGSVESTRIAHRIYTENKPDLLALTGDIVYMHGRASEYLRRFLPVYNARVSEPGVGAPMLSEVLSFTSLGNHCVGKMEYYSTPSINDFPDLHAFFMYWSMPLNGPLSDANALNNIPELRGDKRRIDRFLKIGQERFPRMGNYSFDYGDAHWLVLDANAYMDWTIEELRAWVDKDLTAAQGAKWKFVNYHQPPFTSNPKHGLEKRMRLLCDLFQKHGVDIVFCGHAHYYERTYPLRFAVETQANGKLIDDEGYVGGEIALDKTFDGEGRTKPNGVIYIVTGAGGAKLDPSGIHWRKDEWKPFTHKLIGDRHSFTVCDLEESKLTLRQLDMSGKEIDRLIITK